MVEVGSGDVVPGETGSSASFESRNVVREVGDDHFDDLRREPASLTRVCGGICILARECALEFGFGTVPNSVGEAFDHCDELAKEDESGRVAAGSAEYLVGKTWDSLGILCRGSLLTWM